LRIYFKRDSFDRSRQVECDPPYSLIAKTVNQFLSKLRFVTGSSKIHPIDFPRVSWRMSYLNDDESKLPRGKGLVGGHFARGISFSCTAINNEVWEDIWKLPLDYVMPPWENLLFDAQESVSEVGPSVVLAATALEVFISHVLNELSGNNTVPNQLWEWITQRQMRYKEPGAEEEFDVLLKTLSGTSLKDSPDLWEAFRNIEEARDTFVHEGAAQVAGTAVSPDNVRQLLQKTAEIISFVKDKLLENLQWPEYDHPLKITIAKPVLRKNS
ncbi:MAG: hypothetical protein ABIF19_05985, partial [Planctomycetota bacterium]